MSEDENVAGRHIISIMVQILTFISLLILGTLSFGLLFGAFASLVGLGAVHIYFQEKYSQPSGDIIKRLDSRSIRHDNTTYSPNIIKNELKQLLESEFTPTDPVIASLQAELIKKTMLVNLSNDDDRKWVSWFIRRYNLYRNGHHGSFKITPQHHINFVFSCSSKCLESLTLH